MESDERRVDEGIGASGAGARGGKRGMCDLLGARGRRGLEGTPNRGMSMLYKGGEAGARRVPARDRVRREESQLHEVWCLSGVLRDREGRESGIPVGRSDGGDIDGGDGVY